MNQLFPSLIAIAGAVWVGSIVFQAFVAAPVVFRELAEPDARRFLRAIFPRLFKLGLGCGLVMLAAIVGATVASLPGGGRGWLGLIGTMLSVQAISIWLVPRINDARDDGPSSAARFKRLHGLSVSLTLTNLALGLIVLVALVASPGS